MPAPPPRRPDVRLPRPPRSRSFAHSPLLVFYEITQACDLVCDHCRACAQTEPRPGELTTEQSLRLIDQLTDFPLPPTLVLTGGDPFKRADLFELVEHAVNSRLSVSVTPSPTPLVTKQAIRRLRRAGVSRMAISIDGADPQTHDAIRHVQGSFERALEILAEARREGISMQVNTTLTPVNLGQIVRMAGLLARQKIVMWSVFFLVPVGRANNALRLSGEQCEAAFERLWYESKRRPYAIKTTAAPHYRRFLIQRQAYKTCRQGREQRNKHRPFYLNDGKGVMFVSHTGTVQPSGFMPIACGKFPVDHVAQVYQNSPVFRGLRTASRLEGKCKLCEFKKLCGGSRARAYAVTNNPFAEEPDCVYIPKALAVT